LNGPSRVAARFRAVGDAGTVTVTYLVEVAAASQTEALEEAVEELLLALEDEGDEELLLALEEEDDGEGDDALLALEDETVLRVEVADVVSVSVVTAPLGSVPVIVPLRVMVPAAEVDDDVLVDVAAREVEDVFEEVTTEEDVLIELEEVTVDAALVDELVLEALDELDVEDTLVEDAVLTDDDDTRVLVLAIVEEEGTERSIFLYMDILNAGPPHFSLDAPI
jgi:hypothetical protein